MLNPTPHEAWGPRAGFILAAIGSAVGLGNMWRVSFIASQGGGAAFVVAYLAIVAIVGIPLMTSEFVVGRMTRLSPARAVRNLGGRGWAPLGWLFVLCGFGILSYYSVIAGWTMRYAWDAIRNAMPSDTGAYFAEVSSGGDALLTHLLFMTITVGIILGGVKRGIERSVTVMIPLLFVILAGLALWATTLPGAAAGYDAYLKPDLSLLLSGDILRQAAGQAFFSLSLGMGAMMTYASYLGRNGNLGRDATTVALSDFGVAFFAGLVVFPVVFSFGLQGEIGASAVGALFIALPKGFTSMGAAGAVVDTAFFVMLFLAALTSAISLLEVVVSAAMDVLGWSRRRVTLIFGGVIALCGIPSAYSLEVLGSLDAIVGDFLLVVGGFFTAILVGWKILPQADAELADGLPNPVVRRAWAFSMRYVIPLILFIVIWFTAPKTREAVKGLVGFGG
jgi:NSS family neurotransmitter:Na+ symporter